MPEYIYLVSEAGSTFHRQKELVRCRDCKFWMRKMLTCGKAEGLFLPDPDDYCSRAMRREEDNGKK